MLTPEEYIAKHAAAISKRVEDALTKLDEEDEWCVACGPICDGSCQW